MVHHPWRCFVPYKDIEKRREVSRKAAKRYYAKKAAESEEFRQANRDRVKAWKATHREQALEAVRRWNEEFKARNLEEFKQYQSDKGRAYRFKIKAEMVAAYGGHCVCCNETRLEFLTINHKNGGGRQHRLSIKGNARVGGIHFYFWLKKQGW